LVTPPARDPLQVVPWFVWRWQVEVTFQKARLRAFLADWLGRLRTSVHGREGPT
jgi:hypothetical protein